MKSKKIPVAIIFSLLVHIAGLCSSQALAAGDTKTVLLKGKVNTFGILTEEVQSDLGFRAAVDGKNVRVDKVRLGTEAYYRGLAEGDKILSAKASNDSIEISIERNGKTFLAKLKCLKAGQQLATGLTKTALNAGVVHDPTRDKPATPSLTAKIPYQRFEVNAAMVRVLADYNLQIIMDRSLSMQQKDCPGDLSRWDWCGLQTSDLAKALSNCVTSGLTLVPFNNGFDVFDNASPQTIVDIFNDRSFILGTRLCEPLTFLLDRYFRDRKPDCKPLLIVVITDGEPWPEPQPLLVKDELVSASSQIRYDNEVNVVFLQIGGNDKHGRDYLVDLGENLNGAGARYQYAHTVTFDTLVRTGLVDAIVQTVKAHQAAYPAHFNSTKTTKAHPTQK